MSRKVTARWMVASVVWMRTELLSTMIVSLTLPSSNLTSWRKITPIFTSRLFTVVFRNPVASAESAYIPGCSVGKKKNPSAFASPSK